MFLKSLKLKIRLVFRILSWFYFREKKIEKKEENKNLKARK